MANPLDSAEPGGFTGIGPGGISNRKGADGMRLPWDPAIDGKETIQPIPFDTGGSTSPGAGIPWTPGSSQPSSAPAGQHWDPNVANFAPDAPAAPAAGGQQDVFSTIDGLYSQAGIKDGGNGSGFADRAYWGAHPSEVFNGRLGADLAGTGTDQPDGTPGTGLWQSSGAADRNKPASSGGTSSSGAGFWGGVNPLAAIQSQLGQQTPDAASDNSGIRNLILSLMQGGGAGQVQQ